MKVLNFPMGLPMITLSSALKQIGVEADSVQFRSHSFGFKPDYCLHTEKLADTKVKNTIKDFLHKASREYDLFHFHDMPSGLIHTPSTEHIAILKQTGKPLIIQHHGSEVRRLSIAKWLGNPYVQVKPYWKNEKIIINRLALWSNLFEHAVIADHELYPYIKDTYKNIHVIRHPINLSHFTPSYPNPDNKKPLIVHAPSDREIKGTSFVISAIKRLEAEGHKFTFKLVEKLSHSTAMQIYQQADIIIDQLCIGGIGILTLEGMALGKPVICYLRKDLIDHYPPDMPVVNANPDTIYEKVKDLINHPTTRRNTGIKGREFIEMHHDSLKIAQKFKDLYERLLNEK